MKKIYKWLLGIVATILILLIASIAVVKNKEYQPTASAVNASKVATTTNGITKFSGNSQNPSIIFYPGALVEPKSYNIWAKKVSEAGFNVYIVRFPLDLAVLKTNAADKITKKSGYVIGGHSLGGTMASRYAHNHQKNLKGVFFLASYPEKKGNLQKTSVPVLSITATQDGVLQHKNYQKAKKFLPDKTIYTSISGGNHAGFGSYGTQKGDRQASISNQKQQNIISQLLINWLNQKIIK
ncbi:alpha/beta hydrolase [Companilactobacillus alimentarius]|uniref:alpha/beta hydrolase n=1 Tax=Companilactobacillus alimentarius TaxID=1602 RepID=UPI0028BB7EF6|nr:alpha/beta hydrolase [Companilactobacillus alimentarius]MDT6951906.1 alpha/beta hydrolase [Companilactobacillus alimentarius]